MMGTDKLFVKACDLSIYGEPVEPKFKVVDLPDNAYRRTITKCRTEVFSFIDSIQVYIDRVERFYTTGQSHGAESLRFLREDANGAIVTATILGTGVLGMAAGFRGGRIRRLAYGGLAAGVAYGVIYPEKVNSLRVQLVDDAISLMSGKVSLPSLSSLPSLPSLPAIPGFSKSKPEPSNATKIMMTKNESVTELKVEADKGQTNSEDSDLYTQHSRD